MAKFQVGDKVQVTGTDSYHDGDTGVIVSVHDQSSSWYDDETQYSVKFEEGRGRPMDFYRESLLVKVEGV